MARVSVVIPCYNQARFLRECLLSVAEQTFRDYEIVVVDDGSNETEAAEISHIVEEFGVRLVRQENRGLASARNAGIEVAGGEFILPLDSDDALNPRFLAKTIGVAESDPALGIVGTGVEMFGDRNGEWKLPPYAYPAELFDNRLVCSCIFRRADWRRVGGYNSNMTLGLEDWDFWISILALGRKAVRLPEVLFRYRRHGDTMVAAMKDRSGRYETMRRQIVANHRSLYDGHPRCRARMLYGRKSMLHMAAQIGIASWIWLVPNRDCRQRLRQLYKDIA